MFSASARAFCFISSPARAASALRARDDRVGLGPRLGEEPRRLLVAAGPSSFLRLLALRRATCGSLPGGARARRASAATRTCASSASQHQKRHDGPDVESRIGLDQRVIHCSTSFRKSHRRPFRGPCRRGRWPVQLRDGRPQRPTLLQQNDQQREHLGEDRDAFEQEQREVDGAGDLRRRARLTSDGLCRARCELADAKPGADTMKPRPRPAPMNAIALPSIRFFLRQSGSSDERESPCR